MGFEFARNMGGASLGKDGPMVSISRTGTLGLLRSCTTTFPLQDWQYVRIGYDRELFQLAICKTRADNPSARTLSMVGTNFTVSAAGTLTYFGIPFYGELRRFTVTYDAKKEMLIVDLREIMADDKATKG